MERKLSRDTVAVSPDKYSLKLIDPENCDGDVSLKLGHTLVSYTCTYTFARSIRAYLTHTESHIADDI